MLKKRIAIFGSTGSIGTQTLQVIRENPEKFEVTTLVARKNVGKLSQQVKEFHPKHVFIEDDINAKILYDECKELISKEEIYFGESGLEEISKIYDFDIAVSALVGIAGLKPTWNLMCKRGATVALANKEVLVTGGKLIIAHAKQNNIKLLSVDSEHSAIMQCLNGEENNKIEKILLTASGGPFWTRNLGPEITKKDVLKHPTWKMGPKVTVDSSTMMNKGFEVIEAALLFDVKPEQIEVVVHRQSILHSAVQFEDGVIMANMGPTDMQIPISYALGYPRRIKNEIERVDLFKLLNLSFERPNIQKFPCLKYAYDALKTGLDRQIILNAANEIAVEQFLSERCNYMHIPQIIEATLENAKNWKEPKTLEEILEIDKETKKQAEILAKKM